MINYSLICEHSHQFSAWFRDSADYDRQEKAHLVECPACGSVSVRKDVMAPAIARGKPSAAKSGPPEEIRKDIEAAMKRARDYVEKNFDYVGEKFPEEARRIHYGEIEHRPVYGEATPKEAKELHDEGVAVSPLPAPMSPKKPKDVN